jgi:phage tail-like protein
MAILRDDPYGAFNFIVDLGTGDGGAPSAGFSEVVGLASEIEYVDYRNGNDKENHVRRIPGLHKTADVTLKRGVIGDLRLFEWLKQTREGTVQPRNVTITLLDESRQPVLSWILRSALPRRWAGPSLDARGKQVAIEELVLVAEQIDAE